MLQAVCNEVETPPLLMLWLVSQRPRQHLLLRCEPGRFAAVAYEVTLYSALILVVGFLTIPMVPPASIGGPGPRIPDVPARVLSFALVFAAGALFYAWSWSGGRRTLPMKTWRLRLVRADGTVVDRRRALGRYFAI